MTLTGELLEPIRMACVTCAYSRKPGEKTLTSALNPELNYERRPNKPLRLKRHVGTPDIYKGTRGEALARTTRERLLDSEDDMAWMDWC